MLAASTGVRMFHRSNITYYVSFMGANMIVINESSEHRNNNNNVIMCAYLIILNLFFSAL
jgi:hypothetical protein